ncbi:MAG: histidine kinase [Armatimonadota bacterium]|nr:histidine kinase [Armatimonadota bacterium]MDR7487141.1 histidine kinase [Armatimonadota bacterium]MDR7533549.1 histidine kinase [Armatimonadota bacterium]MDR7536861.1 histidine kinase [Armatimonadota bacterium]
MGRDRRWRWATRAVRGFPHWQAGAQVHALANVLAATGMLARRRPEAAEDLLAHLAAYLRGLLRPARSVAPLAEELRLVLALVGVERARLGGRLRLEVSCHPEALTVLVPPLVLHPLVENAIQHAVARRAEGSHVCIRVRLVSGRLVLAVADDGPGIQRPLPAHAGGGLVALRCRLAALWGRQARVRVLRRRCGGTLAVAILPAVGPRLAGPGG